MTQQEYDKKYENGKFCNGLCQKVLPADHFARYKREESLLFLRPRCKKCERSQDNHRYATKLSSLAPKPKPFTIAAVKKLMDEGLKNTEIAKELGISYWRARNAVRILQGHS